MNQQEYATDLDIGCRELLKCDTGHRCCEHFEGSHTHTNHTNKQTDAQNTKTQIDAQM